MDHEPYDAEESLARLCDRQIIEIKRLKAELAEAVSLHTKAIEHWKDTDAELAKWKCAAHWNKHDEDDTEHSGACDSFGVCNACSHDYLGGSTKDRHRPHHSIDSDGDCDSCCICPKMLKTLRSCQAELDKANVECERVRALGLEDSFAAEDATRKALRLLERAERAEAALAAKNEEIARQDLLIVQARAKAKVALKLKDKYQVTAGKTLKWARRLLNRIEHTAQCSYEMANKLSCSCGLADLIVFPEPQLREVP